MITNDTIPADCRIMMQLNCIFSICEVTQNKQVNFDLLLLNDTLNFTDINMYFWGYV